VDDSGGRVSAEIDPELVQAELSARVEWARTNGHVYDVAVWRLVAGQAEEGLETLRAAITNAAWALDPRWAVVSGDWDRATSAAKDALRMADTWVAGHREYMRALYALIADEADIGREGVDALRAAAPGRRSAAPAGAVELLGGLVDGSSRAVEAGVEALLAWHLRRARARSEIFNSARAVVSLDAVVALLLAHRRGLDVNVPEQYRSAALPLLVLHLREWRGEPLPHALPLQLRVDLVAGEWLRLHGLSLAAAPQQRAAAPRRHRRRLQAEVEEAAVRFVLEERIRARRGSPLQLVSWALMLGDTGAARVQLVGAAEAARRQWQESAPTRPLVRRILERANALPNQNYLREHFALALLLVDDRALAETSELLRAWDERLLLDHPYSHAHGYLDLIRHLLDNVPVARTDVEAVTGPLSDVRVACTGLVERSPTLLARGLRGMLEQHAAALERKTAPDPPICFPAAHVAAAAQRTGVQFELESDYESHDVPVVLAERAGKVGRMPLDLLATALWRHSEPIRP
jgi:hypothetical protein